MAEQTIDQLNEQVEDLNEQIREAHKDIGEAQANAMRLVEERNDLLFQREVQAQAAFYEVDEDEAKSRILQNRRERQTGAPRTIWDPPHITRDQGEEA
jgi:regulator of replication initiation timing